MQTVFPDLKTEAEGILAVASPEKSKACAVEVIEPAAPSTKSYATQRVPRYYVADCPMWGTVNLMPVTLRGGAEPE